jgi:Icc-related predicted phosphoesterase
MKLLCISDLHGSSKICDKIDDVDAVVVTGDITHFEGRGRAISVLDGLKCTKKMLAVQGNCDNYDVNDALVELGCGLHSRGEIIDGIGFFGLGGSDPTPFNTPQEYEEDELWDFLIEGYEQVKDAAVKVLVSHTPPKDTRVDLAGRGHVGSVKVREFVEKYQPDLVLCGHIHEAKGQDKIGKTVIVNPGMFRDGYAIIEIERDDIKVEFF